MKTNFSSKIGIIFITLFLLLSIFALLLLNESSAWFAENRDLDAENMKVQVKAPAQIVERVDYYRISSITLSGGDNIYTFSSTPIAENENKSLGTFSTLVAERQLLIKITLNEGVTGAHVGAVSETDEYIADAINERIMKEDNPLSSVVEFYSISDLEQTSEGYVISSADISNTVARFVTLSESNGQMITSFDSDISIYSTAAEDHDHIIFIMVDYYEESVEFVMDTVNRLIMEGNGKTDAVMGENIEFVSDFTITVSQ